MPDDDAPIQVRAVLSAVEESDGSFVILHLEMKDNDARLALPLAEIAPLVALLVQAGGRAQALAGNDWTQTQPLETLGTEVYRAPDHLQVHFRLSGGLDLPLAMSPEAAAKLRASLGGFLGGATSLPPGSTRQ